MERMPESSRRGPIVREYAITGPAVFYGGMIILIGIIGAIENGFRRIFGRRK